MGCGSVDEGIATICRNTQPIISRSVNGRAASKNAINSMAAKPIGWCFLGEDLRMSRR